MPELNLDDINALKDQLSQLSNDYYGDKQALKEQGFMDKYGSKFKGNRNLGLAIMNEIERQGIDVSAADEAVESILDQIRGECNGLLDLIGNVKEAVEQQEQKITAVEDAVSNAVSETSDASREPIADGIDLDNLPPDAGAGEMPPPPDAGEMPPPPDAGAGEMPPPPDAGAGEMPPPPDEGATPPEEPKPTISDERLKQIQGLKARFNERRAKRMPVNTNTFKPSAGMIQALRGGGN